MIRVMVVDDSALVRRIATDILSADGEISVAATAAHAEFALLKLEKEHPDVITLDIEMPGMGGLEAIRRIMALRPTPIIVLSAHAQKGPSLPCRPWTSGPWISSKPSELSVRRDLGDFHGAVEKVKSAARIVFREPPAAARAPQPEAPAHPSARCSARGRRWRRIRSGRHRHVHRGPRGAEN